MVREPQHATTVRRPVTQLVEGLYERLVQCALWFEGLTMIATELLHHATGLHHVAILHKKTCLSSFGAGFSIQINLAYFLPGIIFISSWKVISS